MGVNANPKGRPLSPTELVLADRLDKLLGAQLPITDPLLAEVSEALHRIIATDSLAVTQWIAGDAIGVLRRYVEQVRQNQTGT